MIPLTIDEVARATGGRLLQGDGERVVHSVTTDSRSVGEQALFVALRGEHADGHDHVDGAVEAGAVAVLSERPREDVPGLVLVDDTWEAIAALAGEVRRRVDPTVVAITGSVGKTTTKDLTAAALAAGRRTVAARGSYNNELGVPLTLLSLDSATEALVVEIGARGVGHIASLTPLVSPDVAIVTAVAGVHLELFGDIDTVARAKSELVQALSEDGIAVLNADDPRVAAMAERTHAQVVGYAVDGADAAVTAHDLRLDRVARPTFRVTSPWGEAEVTLPVAGRHQVGNALAALAAAGSIGVDLEAAAAALADAPVSDWRGAVVEAGGVVILNDAYNANPTSVVAAVDMLTSVERTGRTWAVLGVMAEIGDTSETEHRRVGRSCAEQGVDRLVVVGDEAAPMAEGAREAGMPDEAVTSVEDAEAALAALRGSVDPGDVVLVKASRVGRLETVAQGLEEQLRGQGRGSQT